MQYLYGKSGMRKAPRILIPWLVWGLQFAKYSACERLYQCSRIVLECSLHLCGFAQNKKIAASGRANSLGLPGFCVSPPDAQICSNQRRVGIHAESTTVCNCKHDQKWHHDTGHRMLWDCMLQASDFFLAESTAFFALHGVSSGDLANSSSSAPFCNARHLTSLLWNSDVKSVRESMGNLCAFHSWMLGQHLYRVNEWVYCVYTGTVWPKMSK